MKKVGFFGGSFDPIHFGHLKMAEELKKLKQLDEVWFSPANVSPFKLQAPPESVDNRLEMVRLAIQDKSFFYLFDGEATKQGPSYTIDTIRQIVSEYNHRFYLIISNESVPGFFHWKDAEELVELAPPIVGSRLEIDPPAQGNPVICRALKSGWTPTHPMNISSTQIRQLLKARKDCSKYVPRNVLDFIYQNHLYYTS